MWFKFLQGMSSFATAAMTFAMEEPVLQVSVEDENMMIFAVITSPYPYANFLTFSYCTYWVGTGKVHGWGIWSGKFVQYIGFEECASNAVLSNE